MVWGPRSTHGTPDSWRKILKNMSKNFEKRLGNDLPGHLQSSEFAYAEVHGWQTIPQCTRRPWMYLSKVFGPKHFEKLRGSPFQRYLHSAAYWFQLESSPALGQPGESVSFGKNLASPTHLLQIRFADDEKQWNWLPSLAFSEPIFIGCLLAPHHHVIDEPPSWVNYIRLD